MRGNKTPGLVETWCNFKVTKHGPHILDQDNKVLTGGRLFAGANNTEPRYTFHTFVDSHSFGEDDGFHFSLLPTPYVGNIENADIYILMLNPGFNLAEYYAEFESKAFRQTAIKNLQQAFDAKGYWFWCLDPQFCWHPGYWYWERKLTKIAKKLQQARKSTYKDALYEMSRRIAVVELVPYHSRSYRGRDLTKILHSSELAKNWVHQTLLPKVSENGAVIVVARQAASWELEARDDSIVCYDRAEARSAHLTPESRGGKLILQRLLSYTAQF